MPHASGDGKVLSFTYFQVAHDIQVVSVGLRKNWESSCPIRREGVAIKKTYDVELELIGVQSRRR